MLPKVYSKIKSFDVSAGLVTSTEIGGDYYALFLKRVRLYMQFAVMQLGMVLLLV